MVEGTRAIIIERGTEPLEADTVAQIMARLLRRWRPALALALVAAVAAGAWDARRSGRLQSVVFTLIRPTIDTPSMPGNADVAKAINFTPSPDWNVEGGTGRFEARADKAAGGVELTFIPASADDSTPARCRKEAERIVAEVNTLIEPDVRRATAAIGATIAALDSSIAEAATLAREHSGAGGNSDAVLLLRQAAEMRERQAAQRVILESMQGVRILGPESIVRKAPFASPPVTGALAGCIAFVISLFALAFVADVADAYRAAAQRNS